MRAREILEQAKRLAEKHKVEVEYCDIDRALSRIARIVRPAYLRDEAEQSGAFVVGQTGYTFDLRGVAKLARINVRNADGEYNEMEEIDAYAFDSFSPEETGEPARYKIIGDYPHIKVVIHPSPDVDYDVRLDVHKTVEAVNEDSIIGLNSTFKWDLIELTAGLALSASGTNELAMQTGQRMVGVVEQRHLPGLKNADASVPSRLTPAKFPMFR